MAPRGRASFILEHPVTCARFVSVSATSHSRLKAGVRPHGPGFRSSSGARVCKELLETPASVQPQLSVRLRAVLLTARPSSTPVSSADAVGRARRPDPDGRRLGGPVPGTHAAMELRVAIEVQEGVSWQEWTALARACEAHGVPALYTSGHYLSTDDAPDRRALDPWGVVCALAATTSRLRLGTLVLPAGFRHPSVLAKVAVTADRISGGRVELGRGAGWHEAEHRAFGLPGAGFDVFEEQVEVVRGLLTPGAFRHSGRHYAYDGVDAPVRGRLPLIVGGDGGPRSARIAARFADEYNTNGVDPDECRRRRARLDAACREQGRDPASVPLSVRLWLLAGRDGDELRDRTRALAARRGTGDLEPATLRRGGWIVGASDAAAGQLRALAAAGVDRFVLSLALHRDLDQLAVVSGELAPRLV
jgi:alkanesulfonate monooxygenase SsuD/methylene tetrahydromethanopterin reductase-like flavin-dependent oxidoreductase (luciferase family)